MESESRLAELISGITEKISDWLNGQQWFQELKGKWEELDPQSRMNLQLAALGATVLLILVGAIGFVWGVHSQKVEVNEKAELLAQLRGSNDELRRLRETNSALASSAAGGGEPWNAYFSTLATAQGIPKEAVTVSDEKKGAGSDQVKETLLDVSLKHVNLRQIVRFAYAVETGNRPARTRNLLVDTQGDPAGYMDATVSVSGFAMQPPK